MLREEERRGNFTNRLSLMEEFKRLPAEDVWNKYCLLQDIPPGWEWIDAVWEYEQEVLSKRR